MTDTHFLSLGLDIGTTTSHLIISQLTVGPGEDPYCRHHLLDKKIIHRSDIHKTPLTGEDVDVQAIVAMVHREYAAAGVRPDQILTGAVIITGETAKKRNADAVVRQLAKQTSSFAAAVAGANQEAVLAARGSGAADFSKRHSIRVLNVDIGGGTTNLAWFDRGQLLDAAAIRVGGRHLLRSPGGHPPYRAVSETACRYFVTITPDQSAADQWLAHCVKHTEHAIFNRFDQIPDDLIVTRPGHDPNAPDLVCFSGGVAELMAAIDRNAPLPTGFDDTGPELAQALMNAPAIRALPKKFPTEPIRATVIGAGQFSTSLSGETLFLDPTTLPLTNVPVIHPVRFLSEITNGQTWSDAINRQRRLNDIAPDQVIAICLPNLLHADWQQIKTLAEALTHAARAAPLPPPWLFVMADNFGRLLGEKISQAAPQSPLLVIDEIDLADADFVDLGPPVDKQRFVIPVVAKSLIFK
jgi:ethanolamine utilization protein EutA